MSTTSCKKATHKKTWDWLETNHVVRELFPIILDKIYFSRFSDVPERTCTEDLTISSSCEKHT